MILTASSSARPLTFLPLRTTTTSTSVVPPGCRTKVYVCPDPSPQTLESVVVITTRFGSDQS